jgi:hypothetical protein
VPVLARTLEQAGLSTILVTNMPFWAERVGAPRTLAVEFPFGHTLGPPGDAVRQRHVIAQALEVLDSANAPGMIVHSPETWPFPLVEATKDWQPEIPSPIIQYIAPRLRELLRQQRRPPNDV